MAVFVTRSDHWAAEGRRPQCCPPSGHSSDRCTPPRGSFAASSLAQRPGQNTPHADWAGRAWPVMRYRAAVSRQAWPFSSPPYPAGVCTRPRCLPGQRRISAASPPFLTRYPPPAPPSMPRCHAAGGSAPRRKLALLRRRLSSSLRGIASRVVSDGGSSQACCRPVMLQA